MIDARAVVSPQAELAPDVSVGPFSVIGAQVRIGPRSVIGPHAVINGPTTIGADNRIFQFASIGDAPQDKKYRGEPTRLEIGDRNVFRECCTINRGTARDKGVTRIGNDNLFMAYSHVAHDCVIGNNTVFANCASLGGHVEIGDWVILGGLTAVHQFTKIGAHAFLGGGSILVARRAAVRDGGGQPGGAAFGQLRGAQAARLHRGADPQHPRGLPHPLSLGAEARGGAGAARAARRGAAGSSRVRRLHPRFHAQPGAMSAVGVPPSAAAPLRVGIVAGEHSGDQLGAALIAALRARVPRAALLRRRRPEDDRRRLRGLGTLPRSSRSWGSPRCCAICRGCCACARSCARRFRAARPDVFIGIDSPEFNLRLARRLKHAGMRTVQYVSPQVWAWRQGRVRTIGAACDLVLCLLPFETEFYRRHGVPALFVGHPLADEIPLDVGSRGRAARARARCGDAPLVALLPGSRLGEVARLAAPFAAAARRIRAAPPRLAVRGAHGLRGRS